MLPCVFWHTHIKPGNLQPCGCPIPHDGKNLLPAWEVFPLREPSRPLPRATFHARCFLCGHFLLQRQGVPPSTALGVGPARQLLLRGDRYGRPPLCHVNLCLHNPVLSDGPKHELAANLRTFSHITKRNPKKPSETPKTPCRTGRFGPENPPENNAAVFALRRRSV